MKPIYLSLLVLCFVGACAPTHTVKHILTYGGDGGGPHTWFAIDHTVALGQRFYLDEADIVFGGVSDYETGRADRFSYKMEENDSINPPFSYNIHWERGEGDSFLWFRATAIDLPDFVAVRERTPFERNRLERIQEESHQFLPFAPGFSGITIVEVLKYWTNGDDDYSYKIAHDCRRPETPLNISHGFDENSQAELLIRVTTLTWPSAMEPEQIQAGCERFLLPVTEENGVSIPLEGLDAHNILIPTLTTYWTDDLERRRGTRADDDLAYRFNVSASRQLDADPDAPFLQGKYAKRGNLELTVYWLDF